MGGWNIAWTNPALLIGALGLVVPYLVHLLTKRTPRTLVFPTIQFLKRARANQSAFFRLRDAILLFLRTAFVAMLLLAFLKPVLRARAMSGDEDKRQAAIVIVDASLSMQYNGATPFARAQQATEKLLDHFDTTCAVNVILAGGSPASSLDAPVLSALPLKRDLLTAAPTLERADVDAAMAEAVRQLEAYPNYARSIYLVSDFQRTNWSAVKFSAVPEDIKLVFLPVGDPAAANVAVADVTVRPRTPVLSETVEVVCTVANYGGSAVDVPVKLALRGISSDKSDVSDTSEKKVSLAPGSSGTVNFRFRAATMGSFEGVAIVPDDALATDNTRFFTLDVHRQIDVLLVSDAAAEARSGAHFVWRALDPFADDRNTAGAIRSSTIRTRLTRARDLDLTEDPPQVLVIDGAGPLSEKSIAQIVGYLSNGGAAIYFLSDVLDKGNIEALAFAAKENYVSPFSLTTLVDSGEAGKLSEVKLEDAIFRRFKATGEIAGLTFHRYFATERNEGRGEVLARYGDGNLAMGKASIGAGLLLLCNFSAGRDASDIAQTPAFVPLVHELVKSARPREGAAARALVGFPASGSVPLDGTGAGLLILAPSGKTVSATTDRHGASLAVILSSVQENGFYRINDGSRHLGSIPVNVDPRESDLLPLTETQMRELSASPDRKIATAAAQSVRAVGALLEGVPIWPYLLLAALALLGVEQAALLALRK